MSAFFVAKNLFKKRDTITIDISFALEVASMIAIVGKSGCGKTTTLRLIAGLEKNDKDENAGFELLLAKKNIANLPPQKREVGFCFQKACLFENMNVLDNAAFALICRGMKKKDAREKAKCALEKYGLRNFENRSVETLSGGEAQRVSLVRTILAEPRLILFDEPLSSLDAPLRKTLARDIREMQMREGFAGIFVTHDIAEAREVSDKIIVMANGKKKWEGASESFDESFLS